MYHPLITIHCKKIYGILRILYQTFLILNRTYADARIFCHSKKGFVVSRGEKKVHVTAGVIFSWPGDVIFPWRRNPGKLPEDSWLASE
jgi:hypothetical protein